MNVEKLANFITAIDSALILSADCFQQWQERLECPIEFRSYANGNIIEYPTNTSEQYSKTLLVAQPVTLTPSAMLRPDENYLLGLERALSFIRHIPFGVSLSGLEVTVDVDWL